MAKKPRPLPGSWVDTWVKDDRIPSGVRLVLFALANYMDKRGVCWPSVSTLARDTGYSRRHVFNHLAHGEVLGWLAIETEGGPKVRGGRLNLYRARIAPARRGEPDFTTSESGEIHDESGEIHDTEVVNPTSTERPWERPVGTSTTELTDSENPSSVSVEEWETIIEQRDPHLLASRQLNGLTPSEATWLFLGLRRAEAEENVATDMEGPTELVALALYGMQRKPPHRWSRNRFVGFLVKAVAVRMDPTGHGEPDPEAEDAIRRCWA